MITVEVAGRAPLILSRLGRRTAELADVLALRLREARGRTAAFLGSLLPGLDPMALHAAAGLLRDGVAVPSGALDGIHPDLAGTLVRLATLPDRRDAVGGLARRAERSLQYLLHAVRPSGPGNRCHNCHVVRDWVSPHPW